MRRRTSLASVVAAMLLAPLAILSPAAPADAAPAKIDCKKFASKIYNQQNPRNGSQLMSARVDAAITAQAEGFTTVRGSLGTASVTSGSGLAPVHRLYRKTTGNYFYSLNKAEIAGAVNKLGYADQGTVFYAATKSATCLTPVWSYLRSGRHRFATSATERTLLKKDGWKEERVRFYVGKPQSVFSFIVYADTQQEVWWETDKRFVNRSQWVNSTRTLFETRLVMHTGDVVDWDTSDHIQYRRAHVGMEALDPRIPYTLAAGNHDTAAVGPGGGAADPTKTRVLVRDTTSFNTFLAPGATVTGSYEAGRRENSYTRISAGGVNWLVLTLELWPRKSVVTWAQNVVKKYPKDNVIVVTHSYLTSSGGIYQKSDYGETSPQYLYDNLIKRYPNIKLVFSGHTGQAAYRRDVGQNGNTIHSYLMAMHSNTTNPTRVVEINTTAGTVASSIYAPFSKTSYPQYYRPPVSVSWVR